MTGGCPTSRYNGPGLAMLALAAERGRSAGSRGVIPLDRRRFIAGACAVIAGPIAAQAQQAAKIYRIGLLGPSDARSGMPYVETFLRGLRELGWVEGSNFVIEYRWADGRFERLPELAVDLVHTKVDVIVTGAAAANQPAKDATKTIPIIMAAGANPVESGSSPVSRDRGATSLA